jgi:hypothetical protein
VLNNGALDSDLTVLNHTVKAGDVWHFKTLDFQATMHGVGAFEGASIWCAMVRSEYERQTSKAAAEASKANLHKRDTERGDPRAEEPPRDSGDDKGNLQSHEEEVDAYVAARIARVRQNLVDQRSTYYEAKKTKREAGLDIQKSLRELEKLQELVNAYASEDNGKPSKDVRKEVRGEGQSSRREVGDEDSAEGTPQATSGEST